MLQPLGHSASTATLRVSALRDAQGALRGPDIGV